MDSGLNFQIIEFSLVGLKAWANCDRRLYPFHPESSVVNCLEISEHLAWKTETSGIYAQDF